MFRYIAVSLTLVGLLLGPTACTPYVAAGPTHVRIDPQEAPDFGRVRVTTLAGQTVTMKNPRVEEGSIKSANVGAIPLGQVVMAEGIASTRKHNTAESIGAGLVVASGVALGVMMIHTANACGIWC